MDTTLAYQQCSDNLTQIIHIVTYCMDTVLHLNLLLDALQKDKKDDYSSAIQQLKTVSSTYGTTGTFITTENSDNEDNSYSDESTDQNISDGDKTPREKLKELKSLYDDGLISEEDYNTKKQEVLDNL